MNSSRTWKSGEHCRISGTYRCETCHLAGQETVRDFEAKAVLPMCEVGPDKDTTWRLMKTRSNRAA